MRRFGKDWFAELRAPCINARVDRLSSQPDVTYNRAGHARPHKHFVASWP